MKKGLNQKSLEANKHIFSIDKLSNSSPEILREYLKTAFTQIERDMLATLFIFRGPLSVRKIRSIIIQSTAGKIIREAMRKLIKGVKGTENIKKLISKLNILYIEKDYPSILGENQYAHQWILDFCNYAESNIKDYNNINSEFLISEILSKHLSKAGIQIYGMKRIQDTLENLEREEFVMERKQSPKNKTRLFFLNPKMVVFLRKLFEDNPKKV